jgi:uncharacterized membrane protein
MDQVLRYGIPELHPVIVHFPIVCGVLALVFCLLWLLRDRTGLLVTTLFLQTLALLGAIAAYLSGQEMQEQSEGVPIVDELVHIHEEAAIVAIWLMVAALAVMCLALVLSRADTSRPGTRAWLRWVVAAVTLLGVAAVAWTAHVGGIMTWGVPV